MRGDAPNAPRNGERNLDLLVDRAFVATGAQAAMIIIRTQRLQRIMDVEHAAAAGAQHVPAEIEQTELRSLQEARDGFLLVEAGTPGEIQRVDPIELVVLAVLDQPYDG